MARTFTAKVNLPSYDDMIKPLTTYNEAYDKMAEQYDLLDMEGQEALSGLDPGSEAYKRVLDFNNRVREYTDDFSTGMTYKNRAFLHQARKNYGRDIVPVKKAKESLAENNKYRDTLLSKDSSIKFFETPTVDDILNGKSISNKYISGKETAAKIGAKVEALANSIYNGEVDLKHYPELGKYLVTMGKGFTKEDIMWAISNDPRANKELRDIFNEELKAAGVDKLNPEDRASFIQDASLGLYAGLAKPTQQFMDDLVIQRQQLAMQQEEHEWRAQERRMALGNEPYYIDSDGGKWYNNKYDGRSWVVYDKPDKYKTKDGDMTIQRKEDGTLYYTDKGGIEVPIKDKNDPNIITKQETIQTKQKGDSNIKYVTDNDGNIIGAVDPAHPNIVMDPNDLSKVLPIDGIKGLQEKLKTDQVKEDNKGFTLYFDNLSKNVTSIGNDWKGSTNGNFLWEKDFNYKDAVLVVKAGNQLTNEEDVTISESAKKEIEQELKTYGLTFNDIDIYVDRDYANDNHFKIVLTGHDYKDGREHELLESTPELNSEKQQQADQEEEEAGNENSLHQGR